MHRWFIKTCKENDENGVTEIGVNSPQVRSTGRGCSDDERRPVLHAEECCGDGSGGGGSGYFRRMDMRLADLKQSVHIHTPDFQRVCSESRVDEIVNYQTDRLAHGEPLLFCGDIIIGEQRARSEGDVATWWIIDGQHRIAAMKRIADLRPDDTVSVSVFDLDSTAKGTPTMIELFHLVNQATPVPEYIIRCTMDAQRRQKYTAVEAFVRQRYGVYMTESRSPRKPNANLTQIMDLFFRAEIDTTRQQQPRSVSEICGYIEWCNTEAMRRISGDEAAINRIETKARKHRVSAPFYLASWDPCHSWVSSREMTDKWHVAGRPVAEMNASAPMQVTIQARPAIPNAIRCATWNSAFGGPHVGAGTCACCARSITQQDFECGHVVSHASGGSTTLGNLRPICKTCNRSMGARNMEEFKLLYFS